MNLKPNPLRTLSTLTLGLALAAPALAQKITTTAVTDITFTGPPAVVEVLLKDASGSNAIAQVNVQPVTTSLSIPVTSTVKCAKSQWGYSHSRVGFGAFNPTFLDAGVVHEEENPQAGSTTWYGLKWITEAAAQHMYHVSLNELKNPAKPERQLDVMAEFNAAMHTFIQQGGTKLDFLKGDRTIDVQRHISVLGACWTGASSKGFATYTKPLTVRIKYQGNPQLSGVNIQLGNMGGGQIQVPAPPKPSGAFTKNLAVVASDLKLLTPHLVGKCPAKVQFQADIQVDAAGEVNYTVNFPWNANTPAQKRTGKLTFNGPGSQKTPIFEFTANTGYPVGVTTLDIVQPGKNKAHTNFSVQCVQAPAGGSIQFGPKPGSDPQGSLLAPDAPKPPLTIQVTPVTPPPPPLTIRVTPVTPPPPPPPARISNPQ